MKRLIPSIETYAVPFEAGECGENLFENCQRRRTCFCLVCVGCNRARHPVCGLRGRCRTARSIFRFVDKPTCRVELRLDEKYEEMPQVPV